MSSDTEARLSALAEYASKESESCDERTCPCGLAKSFKADPPIWVYCEVCKVSVTSGVVAACCCGRTEPPVDISDSSAPIEWITCDNCELESHAACYPNAAIRTSTTPFFCKRCLFDSEQSSETEASAANDVRSESGKAETPLAPRKQEEPQYLFDCSLCYAVCANRKSMNVHLTTKHPSVAAGKNYTKRPCRGPIQCFFCQWETTSCTAYSRHMRGTHKIASGSRVVGSAGGSVDKQPTMSESNQKKRALGEEEPRSAAQEPKRNKQAETTTAPPPPRAAESSTKKARRSPRDSAEDEAELGDPSMFVVYQNNLDRVRVRAGTKHVTFQIGSTTHEVSLARATQFEYMLRRALSAAKTSVAERPNGQQRS